MAFGYVIKLCTRTSFLDSESPFQATEYNLMQSRMFRATEMFHEFTSVQIGYHYLLHLSTPIHIWRIPL